MRKYKHLIFILSFIYFIGCEVENDFNGIIISNANVVDVKTGGLQTQQDIYIIGDRITKIKDHTDIQFKNAQSIDASGKYVIPGLCDMHSHIVSYDWVLKMYTALGVTGLRVMHGGNRIEDIFQNRKDGNYMGFEFLYGSPIIDGPGENWGGSVVASNPEEGREIVRKMHEQGYDFLKVYNLLDYETYLAIADECKKLDFPFAGHVPFSVTTEEAIAAGQKSIEHTIGMDLALQHPERFNSRYNKTDTLIFQDLNLYTKEFMKDLDTTKFNNVLDATKNTKTWFCPTLVMLKSFSYAKDSTFLNNGRNHYIPQEELDIWNASSSSEEFPEYLMSVDSTSTNHSFREYLSLSMKMLKPMLNNGTKFLAGTDLSNPYIYPGFSLHDEMQLFVEAGFSELEALQTATLNPAIFAGREDDLGTVEIGKIANLLILEKNPLKNIENTLTICGLIRRGEYLDQAELQKLLNQN
ncbi:Imidazolonepropionase [Flavobacteriaceae bacterium MAR_2010_188]|nr:Imidazolonepropionase [Flavobacteriaceae bacterium MAR_2010_188]